MDYSAPGQLKWEAEQLDSIILRAAKNAAVPAGMALGVDREVFASEITKILRNHPNIEVTNEIVTDLKSLPRPAVIATGPLTHESLAESIRNHFDGEFLYFFDAIAPVIDTDSINFDIAFKADRFHKGQKDYINCPLEQDQYFHLIEEIQKARKIESKEFEKTPYFEGCMPIEVMIERGIQTPRFGPMSPKGIWHPETDAKYYAVVQLRQDNLEASAYNMVGFQTKMAYGEQERVFRMIPGLENAEFLKLGSVHRNLYIQSPKKLTPFLQSQKDPQLFFAGQITGVEGYFESTCIGLLVSLFLHDQSHQKELRLPPRASALGSLLNALTEDLDYFQPKNINLSLFPNVEAPAGMRRSDQKPYKRQEKVNRAQAAINDWLPSLT